MNKTEVLEFIISCEDNHLLKRLSVACTDRRKAIGSQMKYKLYPGTRVNVDRHGAGTVIKVNRTRALIRMDDNNIEYHTPFTMISPITSEG